MAGVPRHVPLATYRLQLGRDLGFDAAASLLDYLQALGISDVYTSPFFETASAGSHGYDVSDHDRVRAELGGEEAFARFAKALARRGLGLLIDVVPNHMGIGEARNAWWRDVLENGPSSPYAGYFDIDWSPVKRELADKVLLPILGAQYGIALDSGSLRLVLEDGLFSIAYYETRLPIAPRTYGRILSHELDALQAALGADDPAITELKSVITWFATIPPPRSSEPEGLAARVRDKETGRERLVRLLETSRPVREFVEAAVERFNGTPGDPKSFDMLDALLAEQPYRLVYWRVAGEEINYRRFFDINELAAIRMEDVRVFEATHRLIVALVRAGTVTGLRVDHPDGLYAPAEYLRRLQAACTAAVPDAGNGTRPFYIVAEKILAPGERLPQSWPVAGTTGYEFLNLVGGVFVDRTQARELDHLYTRGLHQRAPFGEIVYESKRLIMETSMASELNMLGHRLSRIAEKHRSSRDFPLRSLVRVLREIIACFPVYRTYFGESGDSAADAERLDRAVALAKRRTLALDPSIHDWVRELLALEVPSWADEADRAERLDFVMRFQQITGPVTAKGYEDTALYRYNRLVSLNDVGGEPSRFGTSIAEFHGAMRDRQTHSPAALSATSTHDTKRSEDVRARISVLSEIPDEWRRRVTRWQRLNRRHRTVVDGDPVPGPNEEYFLYQTLVGAWPVSVDRLRRYLTKAMREAKVATSWVHPNQRYEDAVLRFAETIVDPRRSREFLRDFREFHAVIAHHGELASLAQVLVKITAPGVPDFYQGTELWDLSLVDPDNRRTVDFDLRRTMLDALIREADGGVDLAVFARQLAIARHDGRVKMFLIRQALAYRAAHPTLFLEGAFEPLDVRGPWVDHVLAYARVREPDLAVVVVPRFLARRQRVESGAPAPDGQPVGDAYWESTAVIVPAAPGTVFRDVFTGHRISVKPGDAPTLPIGRVLVDFPVALLSRES